MPRRTGASGGRLGVSVHRLVLGSKHSTRRKSVSEARTTSPMRMASGSFSSRRPPPRPRVVSSRPWRAQIVDDLHQVVLRQPVPLGQFADRDQRAPGGPRSTSGRAGCSRCIRQVACKPLKMHAVYCFNSAPSLRCIKDASYSRPGAHDACSRDATVMTAAPPTTACSRRAGAPRLAVAATGLPALLPGRGAAACGRSAVGWHSSERCLPRRCRRCCGTPTRCCSALRLRSSSASC